MASRPGQSVTVLKQGFVEVGRLFRDGFSYLGSAMRIPLFWMILCFGFLTYAAIKHLPPDNVKAFGEFIKSVSALAWPVLAFVAARLFRAEFITLVRRMTKLGPTGAEFAEGAVTSQLTSRRVSEVLREFEPTLPSGAIIDSLSEQIRVNLNERDLRDAGQREALLLHHLADSRLVGAALRIYLAIFESQLEALEEMSEASGPIELQTMHDRHVARYQKAILGRNDAAPPMTFSEWATFLVRERLASVTGFSGVITDEGRAFLSYIRSQNLPRFQVF